MHRTKVINIITVSLTNIIRIKTKPSRACSRARARRRIEAELSLDSVHELSTTQVRVWGYS